MSERPIGDEEADDRTDGYRRACQHGNPGNAWCRECPPPDHADFLAVRRLGSAGLRRSLARRQKPRP